MPLVSAAGQSHASASLHITARVVRYFPEKPHSLLQSARNMTAEKAVPARQMETANACQTMWSTVIGERACELENSAAAKHADAMLTTAVYAPK
jgi:hypothetical protein